jgi:hypothetical protein
VNCEISSSYQEPKGGRKHKLVKLEIKKGTSQLTPIKFRESLENTLITFILIN